jgi:hypothetical protein
LPGLAWSSTITLMAISCSPLCVVSWVYSPCDRLSRRPGWDYTELLHHSQLIEHSPVLACQPVIAKAGDVNEVHGGRFSGSRYSHELTLVRPSHSHARNCLVAARNHVLDVHPKVGKSSGQHLEVLDHAGLRRRDSRRFVVLDEVIGELPAETVNVTRVDQVV